MRNVTVIATTLFLLSNAVHGQPGRMKLQDPVGGRPRAEKQFPRECVAWTIRCIAVADTLAAQAGAISKDCLRMARLATHPTSAKAHLDHAADAAEIQEVFDKMADRIDREAELLEEGYQRFRLKAIDGGAFRGFWSAARRDILQVFETNSGAHEQLRRIAEATGGVLSPLPRLEPTGFVVGVPGWPDPNALK